MLSDTAEVRITDRLDRIDAWFGLGPGRTERRWVTPVAVVVLLPVEGTLAFLQGWAALVAPAAIAVAWGGRKWRERRRQPANL